MDNAELLKQIETKLRKPESDRDYLAGQLFALAGIIAHSKESESGLVRGALGGITYAIDRLRELWKEPDAPEPKSLEELKQIYADIELSRFARTEKEVSDTRLKYQRENILINVYRFDIEGETDPVFVFASRLDQTTIEGQKILKDEVVDADCAKIPSFQSVYKYLSDPNTR